MPNDNSCWPDHGEQDIFEMVCNVTQANVHRCALPSLCDCAKVHPCRYYIPLPTHPTLPPTNPQINGDGVAHATYHVSNISDPSCKKHDTSEGGSRYIPGFNTGFHEYAIERHTDSLAFVYDGVVVYNSTGGPRRVLDVPWYLILNFAIGGPWPKPVNSSTIFPSVTAVDYVRVALPTANTANLV